MAAVLFCITSMCQRLSVGPWAYLQDVVTRLPMTPAGQLGDTQPDHWQTARQARLATPPAPATDATIPLAEPVSRPWSSHPWLQVSSPAGGELIPTAPVLTCLHTPAD
jgi:hypothetical protein